MLLVLVVKRAGRHNSAVGRSIGKDKCIKEAIDWRTDTKGAREGDV